MREDVISECARTQRLELFRENAKKLFLSGAKVNEDPDRTDVRLEGLAAVL